MEKKYLDAYEKGLKKVKYMKENLSEFPHITKNGKWLTHELGHWTGGFWTGLLWLYALQTKKAGDFETAKNWALRLKDRVSDNKTHDQGFIYGPSCVTGYNLLGLEEFLPLIHAGSSNMIDLYNEKSGLILAWDESNYQGIAIVDTIMNLPLMWVSDTLENDDSHKEIMRTVAENIAKYHIREDNTSSHVVKWDDNYNITQDTHQGASATSCWSRGQAWALYGFANMYRYTNNARYLDISINLAEYFYNNLNKDMLPAWDFIYKDSSENPIDAAASSIASSGMLLIAQLKRLNNEMKEYDMWTKRAKDVLDALIVNCMYDDLSQYGIIKKVTVDYPRKSGVGESSMYGDYYFMEALYRLQNSDNPDNVFKLY